jgi:hypothetical protein
MPYAEALVRAFEDKFVCTETNTVFSPCRLWTAEVRKKSAWKSCEQIKFAVWLYAYYAVRIVKNGIAPKNINENMTMLRSLGSSNKPDKMPKGGWFALVTADRK